jgi:hypothetical protein
VLAEPIELTSFKLRYFETHVRIVVATVDGRPFEGPGADVFGPDAEQILKLGEPMVHWLKARDPSVRVRGISCDLKKSQVLISYQAGEGIAAEKPIALKVHAPENDELMATARSMIAALTAAASKRIQARPSRE